MYKKIILVMLLLTITISIVSCSNNKVINDYEELEKRGYIVVGLDDTFAPMGFRDDKNELVGFDIDLANAVFDYLKLEVKFQPVDWNSKELELQSGRIDLIWNGLSITKEREENMLFANPYLKNKQIIISNNNSDISVIKDLSNKKVGVQISSAADTVLSKNDILKEFKEIVKYDTYSQALLELDSNTIDAVIMDEIMARYIISKKADFYKVSKEEFSSEFYGIGMRLEFISLKDKINEALLYLENNGITKEISNAWFNEDIFYSQK